jgi:hypothetical protein
VPSEEGRFGQFDRTCGGIEEKRGDSRAAPFSLKEKGNRHPRVSEGRLEISHSIHFFALEEGFFIQHVLIRPVLDRRSRLFDRSSEQLFR